MPNFRARFTSGTTLEPWTDPAENLLPSRINPSANRGHLRRVAEIDTEIEVTATVAGIDGPLDSSLDGALFLAYFAEYVPPLPPLSSPVGQSSVQRFTPAAAGHYTLMMRRPNGGGILLHLDVIDS